MAIAPDGSIFASTGYGANIIHKFDAVDLKGEPPPVTGRFYVFVDECHRTQGGDMNKQMKRWLAGAVFVGFTGTPLLRKDKLMTQDVFGTYIHTYKFHEGVADGVIMPIIMTAHMTNTSMKSADDQAPAPGIAMSTRSMCWWNQIEICGRARPISRAAIRLSGSDSGRGPEWKSPLGRRLVMNGVSLAVLGVLLPTLIHVSLFTLVFMTLGAYRSGAKVQWLLVVLYLSAIALILIAPPRALGVLRQTYSHSLRAVLRAEIDKDFVKLPVHEIEKHLAE